MVDLDMNIPEDDAAAREAVSGKFQRKTQPSWRTGYMLTFV
jgi:hypothetical protein